MMLTVHRVYLSAALKLILLITTLYTLSGAACTSPSSTTSILFLLI